MTKNDNILIEKINLEEIVKDALLSKIWSAINYSSLQKMIDRVLITREDELNSIITQALDFSLKDDSFKEIIRDEFKHKIAKTMVSKLEWMVEKNINKFRQDPALNAKMIIAIENIINEQVN